MAQDSYDDPGFFEGYSQLRRSMEKTLPGLRTKAHGALVPAPAGE